MTDDELLRYSRHILLEEIGIEVQEKWLDTHILVVGCGGLGAHVLPLLTATGVGQLSFADNDTIELSNLQRQTVFSTSDIGTPKAIAMQKRLHQINPNVTLNAITQRLNLTKLQALATQCDIIIDCSDNFSTRYAINRSAYMAKIPLISGSATKFIGQLAIFDFRNSESACYECLFPAQDTQENTEPCHTFGVFAPLVGIIGSILASDALKCIANMGTIAHHQLRCYDALHGTWQNFTITKQKNCPICGQS